MADLKTDLEILTNDLVWLKDRFNTFARLFAGPRERVELMNRRSGHFFSNSSASLTCRYHSWFVQDFRK